MTSRITEKELTAKVGNINKRTEGEYFIQYAYGKCMLCKVAEGGGRIDISRYCTKSELANILDAIYTMLCAR